MDMHGQDDPGRFLTVAEVSRRVGLSRSTIYHLEARARFPQRVSLGARAARWPETAVIAWQRAKLAGREWG
jgi:prophage regulatory protein